MADQAKGKVDINQEECKGCGVCVEACPPKALELSADLNHYGVHTAQLTRQVCSGCGICFFVCPEPGAITVYKLAMHSSEVQHAATV